MDLAEYLGRHPRGEQTRLMRDASVSHDTLRKVLEGGRIADLDKARDVSRATGGQVGVWRLMGLTPDDLREVDPRQIRKAG